MPLAFLHAEILIGWFLTGALAAFIAVAVALWLWRHPPRAPIFPVAVYLVIAAIGGVLWVAHSSDLLLSSIAFALTLPWSVVFLFAVMQFDAQPPPWLVLLGIPLNALLAYVALRWRAQHRVPIHSGGSALAADGATAFFSSSLLRLSLNSCARRS